ncbi:MAG: YggS family pyridoxal phosphate-dependent enzyme [Hyphomicrobiales bacterium]|nr:YggS family pyridoxal phosphate-dependent enzyme [Hyphomicrobiales bacterium]
MQETDLDRLAGVRDKIARAARDCGRKPEAVTLVCVSKTIAAERLGPLVSAGVADFGENRVQEAAGKWPALREGRALTLRLIGPLQTNKAREAVALFDVIETLDRPKLAVELAREIDRAGKAPQLFVQVNIGEEPQKAGVAPSQADAFIRSCRDDLNLPIAGLMCIPPADALASPFFALLAKIAKRNGISRLSMGMSADYELAIQLGATEVRVGSAIFGARG